MDDNRIIALYWERSETAIMETANKYSRYCYQISKNILNNNEDAEECVNDTYFRTWNAIPPKRPERLSTFLGKITRNLSLNKFNGYTAEKRGGGQTELALSELEECIPSASTVEEAIEEALLVQTINKFLLGLIKQNRQIFVCRYWYLSSISDIASQYHMSESKVKSILFRLRNQLKTYLEKEDIML